MKIAIVVPDINFIGGAERVAINLYKYLDKYYKVEIVSLFSTEINKVSALVEQVNSIKHLKLLKKSGIFHRATFKLYSSLRLKNYFEEYDLIIGNNFFRYYCLPYGFKGKTVEIHHLRYEEDFISDTLKKILAIKLRNFIYNKLDCLVVLTEREKQLFNKNGVKPVEVIPNALSFYPEEKALLKNKNAIAIGRLSSQKGFDMLVDIWKEINLIRPAWVLNIFGEGEQRVALEEKIFANNLQKSIFLMGNTSDILEEINNSSIGIMTSRFEGFPMSLLEIMSCGVPVVTFDCNSGPKEIILDKEDGYIIPIGDYESMIKKIVSLMDNEEERKHMGEKARHNIKRYNWEIVGESWRCLITKLT